MQRFSSSIKRSLVLPTLLLCAGWAVGANAACDALAVKDAWVPTAPPGVTVLAGYFEATNTGDEMVELTAVSSPQFERAHMHRSVVDDSGTASMQPVEAVTLAPGQTITFGPGSYHVMLFKPVKTLKVGDTVTLALHCAVPESTLTVTAELRKRMSLETRISDHEHMQHDMDHADMDHGMEHGQMHHDMDHGDMYHGMKHNDTHMEHDMDHGMSHEHMKHDMEHGHMHDDG